MKSLTLAEHKSELSLSVDVLARHWHTHDKNTTPNKTPPIHLLGAQSYTLAVARRYITALEHEVDRLNALLAAQADADAAREENHR
jgi:hypothetical protein